MISFFTYFFKVLIYCPVDKIPGLEPLVEKISDTISGKFSSNAVLSPLTLCLICLVFVLTALEVRIPF